METTEEAVEYAKKIGGYPVILKPTGGGGGIGMRIIHSEEMLKSRDSGLESSKALVMQLV